MVELVEKASRPGQRWSRRQFLQRLGLGGLLAGLGSGGSLGAYGFLVEPRLLEVNRMPLRVRRLPQAFHGTTVALLADLHVGMAPDIAFLHSVVDRVLQASPTLVLLAGDYVISKDRDERRMVEELVSRLRAPLGIYAALGNHEHWTEAGSVVAALERGGATVLRNECVALQRDGQTLYVAGVDDVRVRRDDLPSALKGIPADGCAVLLAHEPDFADEAAADSRVALQLSGHSHGGQVRLPFVPRILPRLGRKYPEGLYQVGPLQLYTSRGIGETWPPVRINCPPELPILELLAE